MKFEISRRVLTIELRTIIIHLFVHLDADDHAKLYLSIQGVGGARVPKPPSRSKTENNCSRLFLGENSGFKLSITE